MSNQLAGHSFDSVRVLSAAYMIASKSCVGVASCNSQSANSKSMVSTLSAKVQCLSAFLWRVLQLKGSSVSILPSVAFCTFIHLLFDRCQVMQSLRQAA